MGRWKPEDDYLLLQAIMQLSNIKEVHRATEFSKPFTLKEIEDRWYATTYDIPISK
jgi:microspherule protein 1